VDGQQTRIGQVFHSPSPDSYYVMMPDGFSEITSVQANLIFGEGTARIGDQVQSKATDVAISDVNRHPSKTENLIETDLPATTPTLPDLNGQTRASMCVWYGDDGARRLTTGGRLPAETPEGDGGDGAGAGGGAGDAAGVPELALADRVLVPPGKAAVVGLQPAPGMKPESYFLITEDGVKFPIPDTDVLGRLGYANVDPAQVPGALLRLIPQGPALTVDAAYRTASFTPAESGTGG
jgi:ESX secretion system ATPase EccB